MLLEWPVATVSHAPSSHSFFHFPALIGSGTFYYHCHNLIPLAHILSAASLHKLCYRGLPASFEPSCPTVPGGPP
jgi:hypothetical protein